MDESAASRRGQLSTETVLVLLLSLVPSVVYSVINIIEVPVPGSSAILFSQGTSWADVSRQFFSIAFDLVPVALVFHLLWLKGEDRNTFGLAGMPDRRDWGHGLAIAMGLFLIGSLGYLAVRYLGIQRFVIPVPATGHWWTVPILTLGALGAGLIEEVIVCAYLITRLTQLGWSRSKAVLVSALLRGSYHLYQGLGGFVGALVLGLLFGLLFLRLRRTWMLVMAHFFYDLIAGLAFIAVKGNCLLGTCF